MLPNPKTWTSREKVTSALFNQQIRDVHRWLENPPNFELTRSEGYTLTGGTTAVLPWNAATENGFSFTKDATGKFTAVTAKYRGRYLLHAQVCGKVSAFPCHLYMDLSINGTVQQVGVVNFESTACMDSVRLTAVLDLEANDVLTARIYASSGRTATLTSTAEQQHASVFYGYWIGV